MQANLADSYQVDGKVLLPIFNTSDGQPETLTTTPTFSLLAANDDGILQSSGYTTAEIQSLLGYLNVPVFAAWTIGPQSMNNNSSHVNSEGYASYIAGNWSFENSSTSSSTIPSQVPGLFFYDNSNGIFDPVLGVMTITESTWGLYRHTLYFTFNPTNVAIWGLFININGTRSVGNLMVPGYLPAYTLGYVLIDDSITVINDTSDGFSPTVGYYNLSFELWHSPGDQVSFEIGVTNYTTTSGNNCNFCYWAVTYVTSGPINGYPSGTPT